MGESLIKMTGSTSILNKGGNGLSLASQIRGAESLSKITAATSFFEKNGGLVKYPNEVAFLIDKSASMGGGESAITTGMNQFLREIPNNVNVTLAKFSENIEFLWNGIPNNNLRLENYWAHGSCTYLNDSIVSFIERLNSRKNIHGNNLSSFIISDGADSIVETLNGVMQSRRMINIEEIMQLLEGSSNPNTQRTRQLLSQNTGLVDIPEIIRTLEIGALKSISAAIKSGQNVYFYGDNENLVAPATRVGVPRENIAIYNRSTNGLITLFRSSNAIMQQTSNPTGNGKRLSLQQTYNRLLIEGGR